MKNFYTVFIYLVHPQRVSQTTMSSSSDTGPVSTINRDHPSLRLSLLPSTFFVLQTKSIPADILTALAADSAGFLSVTRTAEEWSVVGECVDGREGTWRCIKIAGPMEFGTLPVS